MARFELFLFSTEPETIADTAAAGMDGYVVDWEWRGKAERQAGADTEIGVDTAHDLRAARATTERRLICRLNELGDSTPDEVEVAVEAGADELLLPMVGGADEARELLRLVGGRCGAGILVETEEAVERVEELARLPLDRAFVGLNDLSIQRGSDSIFEAVWDGTVERICTAFDAPVGFAGLTLPDRGSPVPCGLLLAEMERLGCSFAFLRRSYQRDVPAHASHADALASIRAAIDRAAARDDAERQADHERLGAAIRAAQGERIPT